MQGVFPLFFPLQVQNVFDETFHAGGAVLLHLLREVAVSVQGEGCRRVTKIALDSFYIITGPNRVHCVGMAQIVEPDPMQPRRIENTPESCLCLPLVKGSAGFCGENKVVGILPKRPRLDLGGCLCMPLRFQYSKSGRRRGESAQLPVLR